MRRYTTSNIGNGAVLGEKREAATLEDGLFTVTHYNVLARAYGSNFQPWFLYTNPPVTSEQRRSLEEIWRSCPEGSVYSVSRERFLGWASKVLSREQVEGLERYERQHFAWATRKWRLVDKILENDPDIITLAECDSYEDFFKVQLKARGDYDSSWVQRPGHQDGACIDC